MNHVSTVTWRIHCLGLGSFPWRSSALQHTTRQIWRTAAPPAWASYSSFVSAPSRGGPTKELVQLLGRRCGRPEFASLGFEGRRSKSWISSNRTQGSQTPSGLDISHLALSDEKYRGHPNSFKDVPTKVLQDIFETRIDARVGNELLHTLQKQRITGTLDQEIQGPGINEFLIAKALKWLRQNYVLDEDAAIIQRIQNEEKAAESAYTAEAERMGLYKPNEGVDKNQVYGVSGLDQIREHYESKPIKGRIGEAQNAASGQNAAPNSSLIQQPSGRAVLARRTESAEWVKRYKERAALSKLQEPPSMSNIRRLLPATIFCAAVLAACALFAQNYEPPLRQARIWPDIPPAAATIITIIAINAAILVLWKIPPLWRFMNTHFLLIPATPKVFTLVGNTFSHHSISHVFGNLFVLWFVGTRLHDDIGRGNFLALYFACGTFASWVSLTRAVLTNNLLQTSLGASGAVIGVLAAYLTLHSGERVTLAFLPPEWSPVTSANIVLSILIAIELFTMTRGGFLRVDHWAHLGGYASGISAALILKHRAKLQKTAQQNRTMPPRRHVKNIRA